MTREEALKILKCRDMHGVPCGYAGGVAEAIDVAIDALKVGKWREIYAETNYRDGWIEFTCENCEYQHGLESGEYGWHYGEEIPWKYCPCCGARMEADNETGD